MHDAFMFDYIYSIVSFPADPVAFTKNIIYTVYPNIGGHPALLS
jgi:hypothetical protein